MTQCLLPRDCPITGMIHSARVFYDQVVDKVEVIDGASGEELQ